jgi:trk system potassium uptake protein TrkA
VARKFLICGLGKFGMTLARTMGASGADIIAVDNDIEHVNDVKNDVSYSAALDSTETKSLEAVGAAGVDVAVVAIGEAFESSVLTIAALKELGVKEIICRANSEREAKILRLTGATRVIQIEQDMAKKLALALITPNMVELVELAEGYSIIEWEVDDKFIGKQLIGCRFRADYSVNVIAIRKAAKEDGDGESTELVPDPSYVFRKGDVIVVIGRAASMARLTGVAMGKGGASAG